MEISMVEMASSWKKVEDENGVHYYVNEVTKVQQWNHPKFTEIKQRMDNCNYVKHAKYRVALKFRLLQQAIYVESIPLHIISGVFEKHRFGMNESSLCLDNLDLEAILADIYFAANKYNHTNTDIDFATELIQNFLFNVYDKERQGNIQVSSIKLVLAVLSQSTLQEINSFIFKLCVDHNNCVTRSRLQATLSNLVDVFLFMHEDVYFGQHLISSSIESCFSNSPGLVGITESNFLTWLDTEPQLLSWIPVLKKIRASETVVCPDKCSTCKTSPLIGLRYRCLKCSRFTQCQNCFFTGRTTNSHKLSHSMREYSSESANLTHNFIRKLCNLLPCALRLNESNITFVKPKQTLDLCNKPEMQTANEGSPNAQLQTIIRQLELQNRHLQQILSLGSHSEDQIRRYLEEHRLHVATQINKLKILMNCLNKPKNKLMESTPLAKNSAKPRFDILSPIESEITQNDHKTYTQISYPYSVSDISTWLGTQSNSTNLRTSPVRELHNDLDDALAKLQQILANNFALDESLMGNTDNNHLKHAVSEVEDMLSSIIDNVESNRANSV